MKNAEFSTERRLISSLFVWLTTLDISPSDFRRLSKEKSRKTAKKKFTIKTKYDKFLHRVCCIMRLQI